MHKCGTVCAQSNADCSSTSEATEISLDLDQLCRRVERLFSAQRAGHLHSLSLPSLCACIK